MKKNKITLCARPRTCSLAPVNGLPCCVICFHLIETTRRNRTYYLLPSISTPITDIRHLFLSTSIISSRLSTLKPCDINTRRDKRKMRVMSRLVQDIHLVDESQGKFMTREIHMGSAFWKMAPRPRIATYSRLTRLGHGIWITLNWKTRGILAVETISDLLTPHEGVAILSRHYPASRHPWQEQSSYVH